MNSLDFYRIQVTHKNPFKKQVQISVNQSRYQVKEEGRKIVPLPLATLKRSTEQGWIWPASLISAIIARLHKLSGLEVLLSKGSFSQGIPHADSVCAARSIPLWDVQVLSAPICYKFQRMNPVYYCTWVKLFTALSLPRGTRVLPRTYSTAAGVCLVAHKKPNQTRSDVTKHIWPLKGG